MTKIGKAIIALAVVGLLWYLQYPQAIQALRNLYVTQTSPATEGQVKAAKERAEAVAKENEQLKKDLAAAKSGS